MTYQYNKNQKTKNKLSFSGMVDYALKSKSKQKPMFNQSQQGHSRYVREHRTSVNIESNSSAPATVRKHRPDYGLLVSALLLSLIGLIVINAVGPTLAQQIGKNSNYFIGKQLVFLAIGFLAFWLVSGLSLSLIQQYTKIMLVVSLILCVIIFIPGLGLRVNGRWVAERYFRHG